MRPRDLALVLLRIYAITLLLDSIGYVIGIVFWLTEEKSVNPYDSDPWWDVVNVGLIVLRVAFGVYLLARGRAVVRVIVRGIPEEPPGAPVPAADLAVVGFAIVGVWFVLDGASVVLLGLARPTVDWTDREFLGRLIQVALGLFLFFGARGIVRVARWARRAGAPEDQAGPTRPTPPGGS